MKSKKQDKAAEIVQNLYQIGIKLQGLGFLLENYQNKGVVELTQEDCWCGIGIILSELGQITNSAAIELDELSVSKADKK